MSNDDAQSMEEFLSHKSTDRGGGFLGNWKKKGKFRLFLHTRILPQPLWQHAFPRIAVKEDDDGEAVKHVWTGKYACCEPESVLKKQYKRDDESGLRLLPPQKCGACKLLDWLWHAVDEGKINWTDIVFDFDGDFPDEHKQLHAAGLFSGFPKDKKELTKDEVVELRKANVALNKVWDENAMGKLSYVFCLVNADSPEDGLQIATETSLLGDKVKDVIADAIASLGPDKGNPMKNPFCIEWEYLKDEVKFDSKYKARRLETVQPSDKVLEIIRGDKPDLTGILAPFEPNTLRSILERHCTLPKGLVPWDDLFGKPGKNAEEGESRQVARAPARAGAPTSQPVSDDDADHGDDDSDEIQCERCEKSMGIEGVDDLSKCKHCGQRYDEAGNMVGEPDPPKPAEPPAQRRRRMPAKDRPARDGDRPKGGPF